MVIAAVKVRLPPAQIVVCGADTVIVGTTAGVIVNVTVLDVAVKGEAQAEFEVSTQLIWSLFIGAARLYVAAVAPFIFVPFFFHW